MKRRQILCTLLAGALLTACTPTQAPQPAASPETAPSGGEWVRQTIDLQGKTPVGELLHLGDDRVGLCLRDPDAGTYSLLCSVDGGETWQEETPAWAGQLWEIGEETGTVLSSPDGTLLVWTGAADGGDRDQPVRYWLVDKERAEPEELTGDWGGMVLPAFLDEDTLAFVPTWPQETTLDKVYGEDLMLYDLAGGGYSAVPGTGKRVGTILMEEQFGEGNGYLMGGIHEPCGAGGRYVYMTFDIGTPQLRAAAPETGDVLLLSTIPGGPVSAMTGLPDGTLYFLNEDGIYRLAAGGTLPELVVDNAGVDLWQGTPVDGERASLSCQKDGSFLVLAFLPDTDAVLYRYVWQQNDA